jgi:hypothetical protein
MVLGHLHESAVKTMATNPSAFSSLPRCPLLCGTNPQKMVNFHKKTKSGPGLSQKSRARSFALWPLHFVLNIFRNTDCFALQNRKKPKHHLVCPDDVK